MDNKKKVDRIVTAERDYASFRKMLSENLAPISRELYAKRAEKSKKAKKFVAKLHATPKKIRGKSLWVASERDREKTHRKAMNDGLSFIEEASKNAGSRFTVNLTDEQVMNMGISDPLRITVEGMSIEHDKLCAMLRTRPGGPAMAHVKDLLEARRDMTEAQNRMEDNAETTPDVELGGEHRSEDATSALKKRILGQIRDLPVNGDAQPGDQIKSLTREELNAMLPNVRLKGGPTDTVAFHDFHHLQIAFPHVWTEAFDKQAKEDIERLYKLYIDLHEEYGITVPARTELEEIHDIEDFLREISGAEEDFFTRPQERILDLLTYGGFPITTWSYLSADQKAAVDHWASILEEENAIPPVARLNPFAPLVYERFILPHFMRPEGVLNRLQRLQLEIASRLSEPYAFHYFAPNTVNFGILSTYRQKWVPGEYQVGDLVSSIPLAPGEKRKYSTKQVVKRSRAETELAKSLTSKNHEMTATKRIEAEITNKAMKRSNFQMTSEGAFRFAIGEISAGTQFALDQAQESSRVKKDFREAVLKAAQEYKQERSLEVKTSDDQTIESTASGELNNPNNELAVTYLLYELERQYSVSERLHRVTPVVMVAQDIPAPHEITESWLLAHEWILRRVLLDDSLIPALNYLTNAFPSDELSVSVKKVNWKTQKEILEKLQVTVDNLLKARARFRSTLIERELGRDNMAAMEDAQGWLSEFFENLTAMDFGDLAVDQMEAQIKMVQKQLDYLEEGLGEKREELAMAREALQEATKLYTEALEAQTNRRVSIDQLRIHIKENILYYMQAIWDHEPPDQRFFRLYHIEVDLPESLERTCTLRRATPQEIAAASIPLIEREGTMYIIENCAPPVLPSPGANSKRLVEIADLDKPLGYKGNYIIFPLKTCVYLTDFMMREFFDDFFGVHDPDHAANFTVEELVQYTEALLKDDSISLTEEQHESLRRMVNTKLRQPRRDSDLIVVPTGELYMEALLGNNALLEPFKVTHRMYDMAKARADWRETELENLRKAARMLQENPDYADPDVDKHIVVEGTSDIEIGTP